MQLYALLALASAASAFVTKARAHAIHTTSPLQQPQLTEWGASLADETWSASVICETSFVLPTDPESFAQPSEAFAHAYGPNGSYELGFDIYSGEMPSQQSIIAESKALKLTTTALVRMKEADAAAARDNFTRAAAKQKLALDTLKGFPDQVALALNECPDDAQLMAQMDIYNEINLVVKMCIKDETEIEASLPLIEKKLEEAKAIAEERAALEKQAEAEAEEEVEELAAFVESSDAPPPKKKTKLNQEEEAWPGHNPSDPLTCAHLAHTKQYEAFEEYVKSFKIGGVGGDVMLSKTFNDVYLRATEKHPEIASECNVFINGSRISAWSMANTDRFMKAILNCNRRLAENWTPVVGDRVEAKWTDNEWYLCNVEAVNGDTFDLIYDNGERGTGVAAALVRKAGTKPLDADLRWMYERLQALGCTATGEVEGDYRPLAYATVMGRGGYGCSGDMLHERLPITILMYKTMLFNVRKGIIHKAITGRGSCTYFRYSVTKPMDFDKWAEGFIGQDELCPAVVQPRKARCRFEFLGRQPTRGAGVLADGAVMLLAPTAEPWQKFAHDKGMFPGAAFDVSGMRWDDMTKPKSVPQNRPTKGGLDAALGHLDNHNPAAAAIVRTLWQFGLVADVNYKARRYECQVLQTGWFVIHNLRCAQTDLANGIEVCIFVDGLVFATEDSLLNLKEWDLKRPLAKELLALLNLTSFDGLKLAEVSYEGRVINTGNGYGYSGKDKWLPMGQIIRDEKTREYRRRTKLDDKATRKVVCTSGNEWDYKGTQTDAAKIRCPKSFRDGCGCAQHGCKFVDDGDA